jgi:uracil-DNA glycosylase
MKHEYDPGYGVDPFRALCAEHPDESTYPRSAFRVEWGPIFHRGRLDGSARLLVIGQDPAAHESVLRRILVGEAGQRVQGFLARLGITRSYVMINTFLYSVYGQKGGVTHKTDAGIIAYRNLWIDALVLNRSIEAVVTFGELAADAWKKWKATPNGKTVQLPLAEMLHPTFPESASGGNKTKHAQNTKRLLANWNEGLELLHAAIRHADETKDLVPYGDAFQPGDLSEIPEFDVPAGTPPWMRGLEGWAARTGSTPAEKRKTITIKIPSG